MEAANRRPSCCTPAILAYSTSCSNSIYHSKPFQRLSHALPTERQPRGDGPAAGGRRGALRGACLLDYREKGMNGAQNLYISIESVERGLAFITEQIRKGKSISNSFGFKALLTKALRFQEVIKTI